MDQRDLERAAARLAAGGASEDGTAAEKEGPSGPEPEGDPDWQKIRGSFETGVKSTFADLRQAIKDEDSKLTVYHMKRMLDSLVFLAKFMKMRDVYLKLQQVDKKLFG